MTGAEAPLRAAAPANAVVVDLAQAEQECGDPALGRVRRAYDSLPGGEVLEVRSPVVEHAFAVRTWARRQGVVVEADARLDGIGVLRLRKPH